MPFISEGENLRFHCPDCLELISKKAMECPHCGRRTRIRESDLLARIALLACILWLILLFAEKVSLLKKSL